MQEEMDRALAQRSAIDKGGGRQLPNAGGGAGVSGPGCDQQQQFGPPAAVSRSGASNRGASSANWSRRSGSSGASSAVQRNSAGGASGRRGNSSGGRKTNSDSAEATVARELGVYYDDNGSNAGRRQFKQRQQQYRSFNRYDASASSGFYNKEVFMQANCQFVVKAAVAKEASNTDNNSGSVGVDYTAYMKDPDLLVAWDLVEEVRAPAAAGSNCPICLCRPRAAKVTKCGHAYCHPCALQYIGYENAGRNSKKCAICAEHIYPADLRSLCPIADTANASDAGDIDVNTSGDGVGGGGVRVGDSITMLLMRRLKGDNRVLPVEQLASLQTAGEYADADGSLSPPRLADCPPAVAAFAKLITANAEDVAKFVVARELAELAELQSEADPEQLEFVRAARSATLARLGGALADAASATTASAAGAAAAPIAEATPPQRMPTSIIAEGGAAATASSTPPPSFGAAGPAPPARRAKLTSVCEEPAHYFYQAADGRHVYLHSLNWQCLAWQYGGIANCPPRITAAVLHVEQLSVTPALRKRAAYLRHLPLTCSVAIAELDLGPPLLSRRCLNEFSRQLDERRRQRQALARQERRLTRRRDAEDRRLMGEALSIVVTASAMNAREPRENPAFTEADPPLAAVAASSAAAAAASSSAAPSSSNNSVRSFAQAAAAWPALGKPAAATATATTSNSKAAAARSADDGGEVDEDALAAAPKPLTSLGDTLGALLAAATNGDGNGDGGNRRQQKQRKKKLAARASFFKEQQKQQDEDEEPPKDC
ncbi:hypothetical protein BOX15_Mlig032457g1 [Macrostomum lignano]|uniref:E3 ubiquitin-protein ligase RNF10 n=1 Tax=Macrostomum lignano TaxID=282301 RepID=A0A267FJL0_9PLAT|nr:hypothetical protein BOX15_Mlig032457g1 [Macrostomum lignano]